VAKAAAERISLRDIVEVAQDPSMRTALTPFGGRAGRPRRYAGRSVPWKGKRFKSRSEAVAGLAGFKGPKSSVGAGLDKAGSIADACKGVKGVATLPDGTLVPARAKCMYDKGAKTIPQIRAI